MPPVTGRFASVSRVISRTTTSRAVAADAWRILEISGRGTANFVAALRQVGGRGTQFDFETTTTEFAAESALALKVRAT